MNTPESLNGMVSDLIRRGLPVEYAERAAAEFADHHRDLLEELRATGWSESQAATEASRRLGDSRKLVKKTVREYQRRYWCARWPLITFFLAPIPILLLSWIATTFAIFCIVWPLEKIGILPTVYDSGTLSVGQYLVMRLWFALLGFAAPAVTMFAMLRLAKRAALDWKWVVVSAGVLGLAIGMLRCQFHPASLEFVSVFNKFQRFDHPTIGLGIPFYSYPTWFHAWRWYTFDLQQICQVLLPTGVAAVMTWRAKQMSQRASLMISAAS
jgi:hypothetical protein